MTRSARASLASPPSMWKSLTCAKSTIGPPVERRSGQPSGRPGRWWPRRRPTMPATGPDRKAPLTTPQPTVASLSTLARLGFEEPAAAAADLERLGAWPPAAAGGGNRLLAEIGASAAPQLAARTLAAIAAAHPDPA